MLLAEGELRIPALMVNAANLRVHVQGISGIAANSAESCTPNCVATPNYIDTNALVVSLKRADLDGEKITGQISIGAGNAGGLGRF